MAETAEIGISAEGISGLLNSFEDLRKQLGNVGKSLKGLTTESQEVEKKGKEIGKAWNQAGWVMSNALHTVISDVTRIGFAMGSISLASATRDAYSYGIAIGRLAAASGDTASNLRYSFRGISEKTLESEKSVFSFAGALRRITGDTKAASDTAEAYSNHALAAGVSLAEMVPLAAQLQANLGLKGKDETTKYLDYLIAVQKAFKTSGGTLAITQQIAGLGEELRKFDWNKPQALEKTTAVLARLGKGLSVGNAAEVQKRFLGLATDKSIGIQREVREALFTDKGLQRPPDEYMMKIGENLIKRYGGGFAREVTDLPQNMGQMLSAQFWNMWSEIIRSGPLSVGKLSYKESGAGIRADYLETDEGKMEIAVKNFDNAVLSIGDQLRPLATAALSFAATSPALASLSATLGSIAAYGGIRLLMPIVAAAAPVAGAVAAGAGIAAAINYAFPQFSHAGKAIGEALFGEDGLFAGEYVGFGRQKIGEATTLFGYRKRKKPVGIGEPFTDDPGYTPGPPIEVIDGRGQTVPGMFAGENQSIAQSFNPVSGTSQQIDFQVAEFIKALKGVVIENNITIMSDKDSPKEQNKKVLNSQAKQ